MSRQSRKAWSLILVATLALTGCHPTQPFYLHEDGDLSHYLDTATEIEHPDVAAANLPDAIATEQPLTLTDPEFANLWQLTLEEAISTGLQNSKVMRTLGTAIAQGSGQLPTPDALLANGQNSNTVYDAAIVESNVTTTQRAIDANGNLSTGTGGIPNTQQGVEAALAEFDAQFTSSLFWNQVDRPQNFQNVNQLFPPQLRQDEATFQAALSKRTATGSVFTVRNNTSYSHRESAPGPLGTPTAWTTEMEMEARFPLMRGRGAQINRIPVVLARTNTDISLADFEISVRNYVLAVENAYWDLCLAYRVLETTKQGRDDALQVWRINYNRATGGIDRGEREQEAREQYYNFRGQTENALRNLYDAENNLRYLMGIAATDGRLIQPIDDPTTANIVYDWREIRSEALVRSAELRRQKWLIKQNELQLIAAKNLLLPQVDFVSLYRWLGLGNELIGSGDAPQFPATDSNAFDQLFGGDFQEWQVGFQFTPPAIGARRELSAVRNAQLGLARERARLEDMELTLTHALTRSVRDLDTNFQTARSHFNRWRAADEQLNSISARIEEGLEVAQLNTTLQAQRNRAAAQVDYYTAIINYNKAIAIMHLRKGSLLEHNNICLAEGPWPEKAMWDAMGEARKRDASYYLDYGWSRPRVLSQGPVQQMQNGHQGGEVIYGPTPAGVEEIGPGQIVPGDSESLPTPMPMGPMGTGSAASHPPTQAGTAVAYNAEMPSPPKTFEPVAKVKVPHTAIGTGLHQNANGNVGSQQQQTYPAAGQADRNSASWQRVGG